jgi:hypothetical protein
VVAVENWKLDGIIFIMEENQDKRGDWYKDWLGSQEAGDYYCTHPDRNPDQRKINEYCRRVQGGEGCPNLILKSMLQNRPDVVWGKWEYTHQAIE